MRPAEFASQLVWREFYAHVLAAWPEAARAEWNPALRGLPWRGDGPDVEVWRDGDLANNNGGWQWAAGTGTNAQPFFRIFNPVRQGRRFDPEADYVRRHVPELARVPARWIHEPWRMPAGEQSAAGVCVGTDYPLPIVDHDEARRHALAWFAQHRDRRR